MGELTDLQVKVLRAASKRPIGAEYNRNTLRSLERREYLAYLWVIVPVSTPVVAANEIDIKDQLYFLTESGADALRKVEHDDA